MVSSDCLFFNIEAIDIFFSDQCECFHYSEQIPFWRLQVASGNYIYQLLMLHFNDAIYNMSELNWVMLNTLVTYNV